VERAEAFRQREAIVSRDPFQSDGIEKPEADTKSAGLVVPIPLTSGELEAKYGDMKHDGIELQWPLMFEDAAGHVEPLTPHDIAALKHLGVTLAEYYQIELERA
jgi:hypothetical protein